MVENTGSGRGRRYTPGIRRPSFAPAAPPIYSTLVSDMDRRMSLSVPPPTLPWSSQPQPSSSAMVMPQQAVWTHPPPLDFKKKAATLPTPPSSSSTSDREDSQIKDMLARGAPLKVEHPLHIFIYVHFFSSQDLQAKLADSLLDEVVTREGFLIQPEEEPYLDPSPFQVLFLHQERSTRLKEVLTTVPTIPDAALQTIRHLPKKPESLLTSQALTLLMLFPESHNTQRVQFEWLLASKLGQYNVLRNSNSS